MSESSGDSGWLERVHNFRPEGIYELRVTIVM